MVTKVPQSDEIFLAYYKPTIKQVTFIEQTLIELNSADFLTVYNQHPEIAKKEDNSYVIDIDKLNAKAYVTPLKSIE